MSVQYLETRDTAAGLNSSSSFAEVVQNGLGKCGGLYVPETIPPFSLDQYSNLESVTYQQLAIDVIKAWDTGLSDSTITSAVSAAYGANFDDGLVAPLHKIDDERYVLELWHGPTLAFKDMALQILPQFLSASTELLGTEQDTLILTATSGDTGSAALAGFADKPGVKIAVFYPHNKVSRMQQLQMTTQTGQNVLVQALNGNFDDCQTSVKSAFGDANFTKLLLNEHNLRLSSANSINWGRLLPQIIYYWWAYLQLVRTGEINSSERVDFTVPTGNFGDILAGWYAKQMGCPIDRLLCASNENNVLSDFMQTGVYDISQRKFLQSASPSMDILISSNLERYLFELVNHDATLLNKWMLSLQEQGRFELEPEQLQKLQADFTGGWADSSSALQAIAQVQARYDYLIDPHTAVAWQVAQQVREDSQVKNVILSTAHWSKFADDVLRGLIGVDYGADLPEKYAQLSPTELAHFVADNYGNSTIPSAISQLDTAPVQFSGSLPIGAKSVQEAVLAQI